MKENILAAIDEEIEAMEDMQAEVWNNEVAYVVSNTALGSLNKIRKLFIEKQKTCCK